MDSGIYKIENYSWDLIKRILVENKYKYKKYFRTKNIKR